MLYAINLGNQKGLRMLKRAILALITVLLLAMAVSGVGRAGVISGSMMVTDVTPVQFCVVWGATEPAYGTVNVFQDAAGLIPEPNAVKTFESTSHPPAEDIGVMKVKVVGLKPETEYFFKTETILKSNNSVILSPIQSVKTEKSSVIVKNDVLALKATMEDKNPALGTLVIATIDKASYPISSWVADGVPDLWCAIDANNFYDKNSHVNLELQGGETINLMLFGGSLGSIQTQETVPLETGGMQSLAAPVALPIPATASSSAPVATSGGGGGGCFISTLFDSF
jgi:hypothetical protein